jgi:hypothetical protein
MDSEAFSVRRLELRAFDLSDRTIRRGEASAVRRVERWRQRVFMIVQCAVTAGLAWLIASLLLGHEVPYFAAAAAILVLGVAYGQRLRRGVDWRSAMRSQRGTSALPVRCLIRYRRQKRIWLLSTLLRPKASR